jgi:hypothetical protein
MTPQDLFDKVAKHLLTQNKRAEDPTTGLCRYRSPDGLKCAVGCLIEDDQYSAKMEGGSVSDLLKSGTLPPSLEAELKPHRMLLIALQRVHDNFVPHQWLGKLEEVAKAFGLELKS